MEAYRSSLGRDIVSAKTTERADSFRQQQALEKHIHSLQGKLILPSSPSEEVAHACEFFLPQHYLAVVVERQIQQLCGYPCCGNMLPALGDGPRLTTREITSRYKNTRNQEHAVTEVEAVSNYCSRWCFAASCYLAAQLSPILPLSRMRANRAFKVEVLTADSAVQELEKKKQQQAKLHGGESRVIPRAAGGKSAHALQAQVQSQLAGLSLSQNKLSPVHAQVQDARASSDGGQAMLVIIEHMEGKVDEEVDVDIDAAPARHVVEAPTRSAGGRPRWHRSGGTGAHELESAVASLLISSPTSKGSVPFLSDKEFVDPAAVRSAIDRRRQSALPGKRARREQEQAQEQGDTEASSASFVVPGRPSALPYRYGPFLIDPTTSYGLFLPGEHDDSDKSGSDEEEVRDFDEGGKRRDKACIRAEAVAHAGDREVFARARERPIGHGMVHADLPLPPVAADDLHLPVKSILKSISPILETQQASGRRVRFGDDCTAEAEVPAVGMQTRVGPCVVDGNTDRDDEKDGGEEGEEEEEEEEGGDEGEEEDGPDNTAYDHDDDEEEGGNWVHGRGSGVPGDEGADLPLPVTVSTSQQRLFGISTYGLLWGCLSTWRTERTATLLAGHSVLLPLEGPGADETLTVASRQVLSMHAARREFLVGALIRSAAWLARIPIPIAHPGFPVASSPLADLAGCASLPAFLHALARTWNVGAAIPRLNDWEWRTLCAAVLAGLAGMGLAGMDVVRAGKEVVEAERVVASLHRPLLLPVPTSAEDALSAPIFHALSLADSDPVWPAWLDEIEKDAGMAQTKKDPAVTPSLALGRDTVLSLVHAVMAGSDCPMPAFRRGGALNKMEMVPHDMRQGDTGGAYVRSVHRGGRVNPQSDPAAVARERVLLAHAK